MVALSDTATRALVAARKDPHGRHAEIVVNDGPLRQTVVGLTRGSRLGEHNSPPAASIQVLRGRIRVSGEEPVDATVGDIVALTHERHGVEAHEDAVFLLTTVTSVPGAESYGRDRAEG